MSDEVIEAVQEEPLPVTEEASSEPPAETPPPEVKPPKTFTQEELNRQIDRRLARERVKFEREASELRQIAMQREQPQVRQAPQGEPKLDDFDNFDAYIAAKAEFIADRKINQTLTEREQRQQAERAQAAQRHTAESWNKRVSTAEAEMPDFHDVVASSDVPMSAPMQQAIMESDAGPKLAYYLATHPDEAEDIASMSPVATVRALTRIEDKLANQPMNVSRTPAPVSPVGVKAKADKDPSAMSDKEFADWRRRQIAQRR
jgi:hypothetical protein